MNRNLTLATFTPAEAEAITGVSTAMQRDWRRRGIISRGDGHARFDLFQLAELLTLKQLSDRGIGPKAAAEVIDWCGYGVAYQALAWIDAYEGDHLRTNEARGLADSPLSKDDQKIFDRILSECGPDVAGSMNLSVRWGEKAEWLQRQVYQEATSSRVVPGNLFIWWANDTHVFHSSFDKALDEMTSADPRLTGPILVLDFRSVAGLLIDRAGRAFVHVEFPDLSPLPGDDAIAARQTAFTAPGASAPGQSEDERA